MRLEKTEKTVTAYDHAIFMDGTDRKINFRELSGYVYKDSHGVLREIYMTEAEADHLNNNLDIEINAVESFVV